MAVDAEHLKPQPEMTLQDFSDMVWGLVDTSQADRIHSADTIRRLSYLTHEVRVGAKTVETAFGRNIIEDNTDIPTGEV